MDVVADTTDPATLRPNIKPITDVGEAFSPISILDYGSKIRLPPTVPNISAGDIFKLFFSRDILQIIVENTNKNNYQKGRPKQEHARGGKWKDTSIEELYAYLAIRIYIGQHPENRLVDYWSTTIENSPIHTTIQNLMSRNRYQELHARLCICQPGGKGHPDDQVCNSSSN